jgi:DNA-binding transcriptional ArsR family regulator
MHGPDETAGSVTLPGVLAALSDTTRLGVVRVLADGRERAWGDLRVPVAKSTLSYHLKVLRNAGVTATRAEGTRCFVRLRAAELEQSLPGLLDSVLAAAAETGSGDEVVALSGGVRNNRHQLPQGTAGGAARRRSANFPA